MNGTITTRQFYIKSQTRDGIWKCQAWENGELFKEWNNRQITQRCQANIYAVLALTNELAQANYKGEIITHLPDELIAREANEGEEAFKNKDEEELTEIINYSWRAKPYRLTRWIYLATAFRTAKLNGIKLEIKLLSKENINLINLVMKELLNKNQPEAKS